jgi:hypothetical protein
VLFHLGGIIKNKFEVCGMQSAALVSKNIGAMQKARLAGWNIFHICIKLRSTLQAAQSEGTQL